MNPPDRRQQAAMKRLEDRARELAGYWTEGNHEGVIMVLFNAVSLRRAALAAMVPLHLDPDEVTEFVQILASRAVGRS